ncbi:MAG: nucleotide sugar dehydrogenase [Proteobacteria bacterium]|nr:nucleotide sugar dehydrogenase [Pseudomonadota bacterium]
MDTSLKVAVIGLGYVGLPLAVAFGKKYNTIGYDLNTRIIESYKKHIDPTGEVDKSELEKAVYLEPTSDPSRLHEADFIIVAVPTPIDNAHQPDLGPVKSAAETAGKHMKKGVVVVFESTVYPGVTEDVCVPILGRASGYVWKKDFHVGYSPERINPGDKEHTLTRIKKVVSGDDPETLKKVEGLYQSIIQAGVYPTRTIKEAEAAKVIENTQRDLNIALMNELAVIFDKLGIDTKNVLDAAGTKWNFLPFKPGLVGGHCIGVDPYYLTYKAETLGYHPEVILAGRRINDNMGKFIVEKTIKLMITTGKNIKGQRVGVLGLTFKEDCPDLRNTRVVDIVNELKSYGTAVMVHDPIAAPEEALKYYDISLCKWDDLKDLGALIIAVPHREYREKTLKHFTDKLLSNGCLVDVKAILNPEEVDKKEVKFWRL